MVRIVWVLVCLWPSAVSALTITAIAPELRTFVGGRQLTFLHYSIPAGQEIVAASIEGTFGNSEVPNTAPLDILFGGQVNSTSGELEGAILVATCASGGCTSAPQPTPWSYVFSPGEFSVINDNYFCRPTTTRTAGFA